jgi:hypothetical protein
MLQFLEGLNVNLVLQGNKHLNGGPLTAAIVLLEVVPTQRQADVKSAQKIRSALDLAFALLVLITLIPLDQTAQAAYFVEFVLLELTWDLHHLVKQVTFI